jgi:short-subunit dehydrogenase
MQSLKDITILITGAAGGIGQAVAKLLAEAGARLILTDRNSDALSALNAKLGEKHYQFCCDISATEGRKNLIAYCHSLMHSPDMLLNVAGVNQFAKITDYSDEDIARLININLSSQIALCRDILPLLSKKQKAVIVNLGSTLGSIGMPGYSVYCASKFGLRGFTEALNRELMDSQIKVRYFAPRATQTTLNDSRVNQMNRELGNAMDSPEYVASALVEFIQKDMVSTYLGWPEKLFVRINSLLPTLVDKSFRKQLPIIKRYL